MPSSLAVTSGPASSSRPQPPSPSPRSEPIAYLSTLPFSRRLPRCPRTHLPITYADIGDPAGVPLLVLMPSGASRWFAAPQDPLARRYGVRLIVLDRPGVGGTGGVSLDKRVRTSCEMVVSVLEHLQVKVAHVVANSAGMYYTFALLLNHPEIFLTGLSPPPNIYFVAPWSPLLPSEHPDYYPSKLAWIPSGLITTQHITLPHVMRLAKGATTLWNTGTKAWSASLGAARGWWDSTAPAASEQQGDQGGAGVDVHASVEGVPVAEKQDNAAMVPEEDEDADEGSMWGKFPCCIACTTQEYFTAENFEGVGQEHMICLNRGTDDTGYQWLERSVEALSENLGKAGATRPLNMQVWWGWQDAMVPRPGQLWFNRTVSEFPDRIKVTVHDVPDGDHTDLLGRVDGIHQVYQMIQEQGHSTELKQSA